MKKSKEKGHADRAHAILAPSSKKRTVKCPSSVILSEGIEQETSSYAEEGTLAHEVAEFYAGQALGLKGYDDPKQFHDKKYDSDMHYYGQGYADFLLDIKERFNPKEIYLERRVEYSDLTWGTGDCMMFAKKKAGWQAVFVDYKYGAGVEVDPEDNEQLKDYSICLEETFGIKLNKVYAYIYQPRVGDEPAQRAVYTAKELKEWRKTTYQLEQKIRFMQDMKKRDPSERTYLNMLEANINAEGLEHCRFCPYKPNCVVFVQETRKKGLALLESAEPMAPVSTAFPNIHSLTLEQKIGLFKIQKQVIDFFAQNENDLLNMALKGHDLNGELKVVAGTSRRSWIKDEKAVFEVLKANGCKRAFKRELITLGEAEKQIEPILKGKLPEGVKDTKANRMEEVKKILSDVTHKPEAKKQLALITDNRQALPTVQKSYDLLTEIEEVKVTD